jgi:hypothetical protein
VKGYEQGMAEDQDTSKWTRSMVYRLMDRERDMITNELMFKVSN